MKQVSLFVGSLLASSLCFAGTVVYTGPSNEKLTIEDVPKLGKKTALLKFDGFDSPWAGKVIQVEKESGSSGDSYFFNYELELSSGKIKKRYQIVTSAGYELKNGSRVQKIKLYYQGMASANNPPTLDYDEKLSKSSLPSLLPQHEKTPFKPDVD